MVSDPVTSFDGELMDIAARLLILMRQHNGVGLAAPQIGVNLRLFVVNHTGQKPHDLIVVNPILSKHSGAESTIEGCLSLPATRLRITRSFQVKLTAQDITGKPFERIGYGKLARIWQHEFDHLNGILITDRAGTPPEVTPPRRG